MTFGCNKKVHIDNNCVSGTSYPPLVSSKREPDLEGVGCNKMVHINNNCVSDTSRPPPVLSKRERDQEGAVSLLEMKSGNFILNKKVAMTPWKIIDVEEEFSLSNSIPEEKEIIPEP